MTTTEEQAVRRHAEQLGLTLHRTRRAFRRPWTFRSPDPDAQYHGLKLWSIAFPDLATADEFLDRLEAEADN